MKKKIEEIPIFECLPDGSLNFISMVTYPAMEEVFLQLSKEEEPVELKLADEEKHIVTGPALVPNRKFIRYNKKTKEPFYAFFSEQTIENVSQTFLRDNKNYNWDTQHNKKATNNTFITESWIVADPENDKAKALGFDVPAGTWMVSAKITDDNTWQRIKSGELRGFSIDGDFFLAEYDDSDDVLLEQIKDLVSQCEE